MTTTLLTLGSSPEAFTQPRPQLRATTFDLTHVRDHHWAFREGPPTRHAMVMEEEHNDGVPMDPVDIYSSQ